MSLNIKWVKGGVCAPKSFLAAGGYCGLRKNPDKKDLAIIYSPVPCNAAAVYTTNQVKAAPLYVTMDHLKDGKAQAVIANSGNANACVPDGREHAERMTEALAKALNIAPEDCIVASTGIIGVPLNIECVETSTPKIAKTLSFWGSRAAAEAIMTTDTYFKEAAVKVKLADTDITIGAISKGSGMIHPNMGTTLSFMTTDANISSPVLQEILRSCVKKSFNRISVDGDTSTNDMACILASGAAENPEILPGTPEYEGFSQALMVLCTELAKKLAADGEGATRLISCTVKGCETEDQAEIFSKAVIASSLVKAAMFGRDPNWGRILCAMGYSGAAFTPETVDISFTSDVGQVQVCRNGAAISFNEVLAKKVLSADSVDILVNMKSGTEEATAWGCDLTYDYVKINGEYHT